MSAPARKYDSPLRTRLAGETRDALVAAGRVLFADQGFTATTIEAISERAGMTRGAFYKHFHDKETLFETVVRDFAEELVAYLWDRSYELATNREERERFAARLFVERMSAPDAHRILGLDGPAVLGHDRWTEILAASIFEPLQSAVSGWGEKGLVPARLVEPLTHLLAGLFHTAATQVASARDGAAAARKYEDALVYTIQSLRGECGRR